MIKKYLIEKIGELSPKFSKQFEDIAIEDYHTISHLIDHEGVMRRVNRIMPQNLVDAIRSTSLMDQLKNVYD